MAYSFVWPKGDGGRSNFTARQAAEKREKAVQSHQLSMSRDLLTSPEARNELLQAHQRYEELEAARKQAIADAAQRVRYIRWTGIVLVALGVAGYVQQRNQES